MRSVAADTAWRGRGSQELLEPSLHVKERIALKTAVVRMENRGSPAGCRAVPGLNLLFQHRAKFGVQCGLSSFLTAGGGELYPASTGVLPARGTPQRSQEGVRHARGSVFACVF